MRVRSWSVGVLVALSALLVSSRHALGRNGPPSELPRYRVDVVEFTSAAFYGYDINDRGQVALASLSPVVPFTGVARRWDPRDGFLTLAPEQSLSTGINK